MMFSKVLFAMAGSVLGAVLGLMFAVGAVFVIGVVIDLATNQWFGGFGIMSVVFWLSLPVTATGACYGGVRGFRYG